MQDEYLDVVDENDKVINKDWRNSIYAKGLNHNIRVVNVFIFNYERKLLVPKRSMNRRIFPGCFDFSCGEHVISGEDYYQAAKRGLEEELGIKNIKLIELGKLTPKDGVSCFMKVYKMEYNEDITNYDKNGIDKLYWYSLEEIRKMIIEDKAKFKGDFSEVLEVIQKSYSKNKLANTLV